MRGREARRACPSLQMVQVPTANGKADLELYREAGAQVLKVLCGGGVCERASIDEAYVDVTRRAQELLATARRQGKLDTLLCEASAATAGGMDPVPTLPWIRPVVGRGGFWLVQFYNVRRRSQRPSFAGHCASDCRRGRAAVVGSAACFCVARRRIDAGSRCFYRR